MKPTYEELVSQLERSRRLCDEALKSEIAWEMAMMKACGEDGPASVSAKFMELQSQNADMAVQLANSESKCRELAAEAAYLRGEIEQHSNSTHFCEKCGEADPCINDDVCWSLKHPIPATDVFLAEVRAHGVEMFAAVLRRKGDDAFFDAIAEAQANAADQFSAQLRQGGAE